METHWEIFLLRTSQPLLIQERSPRFVCVCVWKRIIFSVNFGQLFSRATLLPPRFFSSASAGKTRSVCVTFSWGCRIKGRPLSATDSSIAAHSSPPHGLCTRKHKLLQLHCCIWLQILLYVVSDLQFSCLFLTWDRRRYVTLWPYGSGLVFLTLNSVSTREEMWQDMYVVFPGPLQVRYIYRYESNAGCKGWVLYL